MNSTSIPRRGALLRVALAASAVTVFAAGCAVSVPANIEPVQNFDAAKYMGQWYEIARIDQRFQKGLTKATANYALNSDGTVKVINRGFNAEKNEWKEVEGKAKFIGNPKTAALKVSFFGPFYGGYNVVYLDPAYQTSLVIGENTDYFWLLSRKPDLPKDQVQALLQKAQSLGVDLNKVIMAR
ncbi:MAG: lipocalin family protein [Comamonas sp.]